MRRLKRSGFDALKALNRNGQDGSSTKKHHGQSRLITETAQPEQYRASCQESITGLDASLRAEDERIAAEQDRIDNRTKDIQERMAAADALIAQMEQQATYITNMFESMRVNQKSY